MKVMNRTVLRYVTDDNMERVTVKLPMTVPEVYAAVTRLKRVVGKGLKTYA